MGEDFKVQLRNQRRDANEMIKQIEKDKECSEDDSRRGQTKVQEVTDEHVKQVDEVLVKKEAEIMEV
jgi:ribosome recycling factor